MEKENNNKGLEKEKFIQSATKDALLQLQQEIEKHKIRCGELNSDLDSFHKYKKRCFNSV